MNGDRVDFAQLIKIYFNSQEPERRYSPGEMVCAVPNPVSGNPKRELICTSHIERFNLTLRTIPRRMTRLTCAFSKKLENHRAAIALSVAQTPKILRQHVDFSARRQTWWAPSDLNAQRLQRRSGFTGRCGQPISA